MSEAGAAFEAGNLTAALAAATAAVKARPREPGTRWLLAEMLVFAGEIERADRILDAAALEDPSPAVLEFRRLLRAEEARKRCLTQGGAPKMQGEEATPALAAALRSLVELRAGTPEAAAAAAAEAESLRPRAPGKAGDAAFDDFRDADDVFAPMVELITAAGDYMWVPVERIRRLDFDAPRRPRDLYWRRCTIELKDGTEGLVFVPAVYLWTDPATPDLLKLGRETDWPDAKGGPQRGLGRRLFLAGEEALDVMALDAVAFA
jgi:type VI secretion system protein ImpE